VFDAYTGGCKGAQEGEAPPFGLQALAGQVIDTNMEKWI
jgi:hypothetical protein